MTPMQIYMYRYLLLKAVAVERMQRTKLRLSLDELFRLGLQTF